MARSPINMRRLPKDEGRVVDDDVSSGSDPSFENEDIDVSPRINSGSIKQHAHTESLQSRRRRRHGSRRHKGGSRHKHKGGQPYPAKDDETYQMKQKSIELLEKENAASVVRHDGGGEQFVTFPVAPFNSTQFLMDEHCESSDIHKSSFNSAPSSCSSQDNRLHSVPSTPVEFSHDTISFEKKDREFSDFFTSAHEESLQSLPKAELVKHYMDLEEKIAVLQKKVAENQQREGADLYSQYDGHSNQVCDSNCNSDTNSLSSSNEEFVDLSTVNETSVCVEDSGEM